MKTVSKFNIFSYIRKDKEGNPVVSPETGKPEKHYRFIFNDGSIVACAFLEDMMPEVLQALAAAPRSETRVSKKGEPFQTTLKSYVIDFRPLVSNDPAHHRAFINSIEEHKLPKVDFGF